MKTQNFKKWTKTLLVLLLSFGFTSLNKAEANPFPGVSFQVFYDELAPYGDWVYDQNQGYVWLPTAEQGFHPYGSNGHWAMTAYGNTWVSYYDWGWAPFHYGRWYFDNYYQSWAWVPGYDWGPAWVDWRTGGGYYGWAPLAPGYGLNVSRNLPSFYFVFIPRNRIYHHYAHRYYAPYRNRVRIYNQTTIINNTVIYNNNRYVAGPNRREIERVTRRTVPVYEVQGSDRAGRAAVSRNSISLYRPDLQNSRDRSVEARPSRTLDANQARPSRSQASDASVLSPSRSTQNQGSSRAAQSNVATPSRGERSVVSPSDVRSRNFESRPYEENQIQYANPTRESQIRRSTSPSPSRSTNPASVGRTENRINEPTYQRTPSTAPQTRSTAPQQIQRKSEVHTADPSRSSGTSINNPAPRRSTSPAGNSTPSRTSNSRVTPAPSSTSSPRVITPPEQRTSTAPTRTSSSRGNREN